MLHGVHPVDASKPFDVFEYAATLCSKGCAAVLCLSFTLYRMGPHCKKMIGWWPSFSGPSHPGRRRVKNVETPATDGTLALPPRPHPSLLTPVEMPAQSPSESEQKLALNTILGCGARLQGNVKVPGRIVLADFVLDV